MREEESEGGRERVREGQMWDAAYKLYQNKQYLRPEDIHLTLGRMRCLHAMGEG